MATCEYKAVPAPRRGKKQRGLKGKDVQFAAAIEEVIQELALDGWRYLRSDHFQAETRAGLFSRAGLSEQTVMIFERPLSSNAATAQPAPQAERRTAAPQTPAPLADAPQPIPPQPAAPQPTAPPPVGGEAKPEAGGAPESIATSLRGEAAPRTAPLRTTPELGGADRD